MFASHFQTYMSSHSGPVLLEAHPENLSLTLVKGCAHAENRIMLSQPPQKYRAVEGGTETPVRIGEPCP